MSDRLRRRATDVAAGGSSGADGRAAGCVGSPRAARTTCMTIERMNRARKAPSSGIQNVL